MGGKGQGRQTLIRRVGATAFRPFFLAFRHWFPALAARFSWGSS